MAKTTTGLALGGIGGFNAHDAGPITMNRPLGFFNYFIEKADNYTEGYEQATKIFAADRSRLNALART
jgi:hypothetical protein